MNNGNNNSNNNNNSDGGGMMMGDGQISNINSYLDLLGLTWLGLDWNGYGNWFGLVLVWFGLAWLG